MQPMQYPPGIRDTLLLVVASFALACGPERAPFIPLDGGPRRDGGGQIPGGSDAGGRDGGAARDSSVPSQPDAGPSACTLDPDDVHDLGEDTAGDRTVGLAAGGNGFGVVFTAYEDDTPPAHVRAVHLSSFGELGTIHTVTSDFARRLTPAVAAFGTSWVAAWVDNATDSFELVTRALGADLAPAAGPAHPITAAPAVLESLPTLFASSSGLLLAWIDDDGTARKARVLPIEGDGSPAGTAGTVTSAGQRPGSLALGELADGPVLVYSESVGGGGGEIWLQGITPSGAARGSAKPLTVETNADGTVDAAVGPTGGAVVFGAIVGGVRREVRFRALDGDGELVGDERVLGEGSDASIAAFAGGYVVSYRAPAEAEAEIRLLLVNPQGDRVQEVLVSEALPQGGRTTVRVSGDGRIAVAWADSSTGGTSIRAAVVACGNDG